MRLLERNLKLNRHLYERALPSRARFLDSGIASYRMAGSRMGTNKNASLRLAASEHAALTKSRDNFGVIREMESHMDAESPSCEARCSR